jgi:hypothetical protein
MTDNPLAVDIPGVLLELHHILDEHGGDVDQTAADQEVLQMSSRGASQPRRRETTQRTPLLRHRSAVSAGSSRAGGGMSVEGSPNGHHPATPRPTWLIVVFALKATGRSRRRAPALLGHGHGA